MARKNKNEEVTIVAASKDSDEVTDLQLLIGDKVIGEIFKDKEDRHYQLTLMNKQKGTAISIDDAVQTILADYNLHR